MALYWPREKVALDIVDDPNRNPFEGSDDYTVLRVTCAELTDRQSFYAVMRRLARLLGCEVPASPEWYEQSTSLHALLASMASGVHDTAIDEFYGDDSFAGDTRGTGDLEASMANVEIIASSEEEADLMRSKAIEDGRSVRGISIWDGPVPEGSFEDISSNMRMSTPEYFFFRKANTLSFPEAVELGMELCGRYRTIVTQYNADGEDYDYLPSSRTSTAQIRTYLRGARGSKEFKRAHNVLEYVIDGASSPMNTYLYLRLCLSMSRGGYGLPKADVACVYETDDGLMPSEDGPFLAYDLVWPEEQVVVQYVGRRVPDEHDLRELSLGQMRVFCVTDDDLRSDKRFARIARGVAEHLGKPLPDDNDQWKNARKRFRRRVDIPPYANMRLTLHDIERHSS